MQRHFLPSPARIVAVIGLLLLCVVNNGLCETPDTTALQKKIDQTGAGWIAGDNDISRRSVEDRKKLLGTIIDPEAEAFMALSATHFATFGDGPLPAKLDYRNINGRNYVTPVRDQGHCGACWAFATTGALESAILRTYNRSGEDVDLAEQVLISSGAAGA